MLYIGVGVRWAGYGESECRISHEQQACLWVTTAATTMHRCRHQLATIDAINRRIYRHRWLVSSTFYTGIRAGNVDGPGEYDGGLPLSPLYTERERERERERVASCDDVARFPTTPFQRIFGESSLNGVPRLSNALPPSASFQPREILLGIYRA